MTTIGQNSPATPAPSTAEPSGVGSRRASARIGTRVPSAVVLSATPSSQASASRPAWCKTRPIARPIASEIAQPIVPRTSERRATRCSISSRPAKKNRNTRPRSARKSMWLSISARPNPSGPMRIPSTISSTTVGRTIRSVEPRQDRSGTCGGEDEHERPGVRQRRLRGNRDEGDHGDSEGERPQRARATSRPARAGSRPRRCGTRSAGRSWARRRGCAG